MADLKPLGSEKLKGDEKIKRILELTYYKTNDKKVNEHKNAEFVVESTNCVYGIVKENDDYYVKKGLTEETLDYIGGMFMKNKNRFSSYATALKRLELLKGQEELLREDKKYILKVNKPKPAAPAPAPAAEAPMDVPPMPDSGGGSEPNMPPNMGNLDDMAADLPPDDQSLDNGDEEGGDYLKEIQKLTGKLGEKLRDFEDQMVADDIKYVINSVVSAVDLDKLEDSDKEDILSQFEDNGDEMGDAMGDIPSDDSEITEEDPLQRLVDTVFDFNDEEDQSEIDEIGDNDFALQNDAPSGDESEVEICKVCKGTGIKNGKECVECNGEGIIFADDNEIDIEDVPKGKDLDVFDLLGANDDDDDEGYDPIEMGETDEEYTGEEVFSGIGGDEGDIADVVSQEIELDELTNTITQSVKETLGKYFE